MSSPSNALPLPFVDRLFDRLVAIYGAQRVGAMWHGTDIGSVKEVWAQQLGRYQPATIAAALQRLVDGGDGWPPTLPEFVEVCRQAALGRAQSQNVAALPAPGNGYTDIETAKANLERIREMVRQVQGARMTCRSCHFSAQRADGTLWCWGLAKPAIRKCAAYQYEPGTDASETDGTGRDPAPPVGGPVVAGTHSGAADE